MKERTYKFQFLFICIVYSMFSLTNCQKKYLHKYGVYQYNQKNLETDEGIPLKTNNSTTQINKIPTTIVKIPNTIKPRMNKKIISSTTIIKTLIHSTNDLSEIKSQILYETNPLSTSLINTKPKIISSINNPSPIKEKVIFVLQIQVINNKLTIFSIINFAILKSEYISFVISIKINNKRNLQLNNKIQREINFYPDKNYQGNGNEITRLISSEEVNSNNIILEILKIGEQYELKLLNNNSDILDTQKVQEKIKNGGIDFSKDSNDYIINQYKIKSATKGCKFNLYSENIINESNKNIELNFIELNKNNNIKAKCLLSSENKNKIPCDLKEEINGNYSLEPYIYSDTNKIITIVQNNVNDYLYLECEAGVNNYNHKKSSSEISVGVIFGVVAGIFCNIIIILLMIRYIYIRRRWYKSFYDSMNNNSENDRRLS